MLPHSFHVAVTPREVSVRLDSEPEMKSSQLIQYARDFDAVAVIQGNLLNDDVASTALKSRDIDGFARQLISAYRDRGVAALATLEGDFAFCLIDLQSRVILAGRDEKGGYPLFVKCSETGFRISSSHKSLCAGSTVPTVDPNFIASFLQLPNAGMNELPHTTSAFRGHQRVLPGQITELRLADRPEQRVVANYWNNHFESVDQGIPFDDAVGRVRSAIELAVGRRLCGTVGSHFSGGIDSTAIALLAARLATNCDVTGTVHGFAKVFPDLRHLAQEQHYIDCAASLEANLKVHRVPFRQGLYYSGIESLPLYDEPHPGLPHAHQSAELCNSIARTGVDVLLTGVGGDHVFDASLLITIADAIAHGRFRRALSIAELAGRQYDESRWSLLRQSLPHLMPLRLRSGIGSWLRQGRAEWMRLTDQTIAPWVNPKFARQFNMFERALSFMPERLVRHSDAASQYGLGIIRQQVGDYQRWYPALRAGMRLSHPFFDRQLVEMAMRIPALVRCKPGRQKWLLTSALSDVLPREIIERRKKGHFGELIDSGFAAQQRVLAELIDRAPIDDDIISKPTLHQCLQFAACGAYRDMCGLDRLNLTLSLLHWLDRLPAWQAEPISSRELLNEPWPAREAYTVTSSVTM